jgi:hypothetical protein
MHSDNQPTLSSGLDFNVGAKIFLHKDRGEVFFIEANHEKINKLLRVFISMGLASFERHLSFFWGNKVFVGKTHRV